MSQPRRPLLEVQSVSKWFPIRSGFLGKTEGHVHALTNVSFDLYRGETLGLVGESGCGKSTLGRCILRLLEPSSGQVKYDGESLHLLSNSEMRKLRRKIQVIFQDPYASLNPRMTVEQILMEPLKVHSLHGDKEKRLVRILKLLDMVGLRKESLTRYPHEFSGGQRQRICIARALAVEPEFIVCDEPVSALDVSIQAQIINLLKDLQKELKLTYLFIAHDLNVVEHISDRVAVMYLGKIVEIGPKQELFSNPIHPYTKALLSAIPQVDPEKRKARILLRGDVPSSIEPPTGCYFHPRCPEAQEGCQRIWPDLKASFAAKTPDHQAACLVYQDETPLK